MHKGNVTIPGGPRSWRKCPVHGCGKIVKGARKLEKHTKERHS